MYLVNGWRCVQTPGNTSFQRLDDGVLISGDASVTLLVNSWAGMLLDFWDDFAHDGRLEEREPGGDREALHETVAQSTTAAVIAPNMAKQIVGFQAMMAYAAETFPGLFDGYSLEIRESHQKGKADTSGTAKAMVRYFNQMGLDFNEDQIAKERDPDIQANRWKIPQNFLTGHGWHTYALTSADHTVRFEFTHNVNGRDVYARGTLDAVRYLQARVDDGAAGIVFSMIDVLQNRS